MKGTHYYIAILCSSFIMLAAKDQAVINDLKRQIATVKQELYALVEEVDQTGQLRKNIDDVARRIKDLEDHTGLANQNRSITDLLQKIEKRRYDTCLAINNNPKAVELHKKIKEIEQPLSELYKEMRTALDDDEIRAIQTKIRAKVKELAPRVKPLNEELYSMFKQALAETKQLKKELRAKYKEIEFSRNSLRKELRNAINALFNAIAKKKADWQSIQDRLHKLEYQLDEKEPCRRPEYTEPTWRVYIA